MLAGTRLSTLGAGQPTLNPWTQEVEGLLVVNSLAAGSDRFVAGNAYSPGTITEWAIPDPQAIVERPQPKRIRMLLDPDNYLVLAGTMQVCCQYPHKPNRQKRSSL